MLTKWAKKINNIRPNNNIIYGVLDSGTVKACVVAKSSAGNNVNIGPSSVTANNTLITSFTETGSSASSGIALGSDATAATDEDYNVKSLITTLTFASTPSPSQYYDKTTGKYYGRVDITLNNNTASDVTVNEVAKFVRFYKATNLDDTISTSASNGVSVMVDRTVLDSPLTVPAGGVAVLRYQFAYDVDAAPTS